MVANYTIYIVNQSTVTQTFSCFLQPPAELANNPHVLANPAPPLAVPSNSTNLNCFVIPAQYAVGAGASNNAVALNARVTSSKILNADLTDQFSAVYADVPPDMGPTLTQSGTGADPRQISISANAFNQTSNEDNGWFARMSFGVQTDGAIMGMTWSPSPSQTTTLTPLWNFSVTAKSYTPNLLVEYSAVSKDAAQLTPSSFQYDEATVTYTPTGTWQVAPGKPSGALNSRRRR